MSERRDHRVHVLLSKKDYEILLAESKKQKRAVGNLAAAWVISKCEELYEKQG